MQDSDKKKTCNIGNLVGVEYYVYIMLNNNDDYCLHKYSVQGTDSKLHN